LADSDLGEQRYPENSMGGEFARPEMQDHQHQEPL
jgi:hypothetical protein